LEPDLQLNVLGGIHFKCDAHLYPNKLMEDLKNDLGKKEISIHTTTEITDFIIENQKIRGVQTNKGEFFADEFVLAAGAVTGEVAGNLKLKIPMIGGRGYSVTFDKPDFNVHHPIILTEARVAITPMAGDKVRLGGTMEITSFNSPPKLKRVDGIFESVKKYFPDFNLAVPYEKIWYGYRPCSADGLPYIGRPKKYKNLVIASGHAMLGLSLGAGTGKLVSEIISQKLLSVNIAPFDPDRFN
jgi:D-amino-acid dehydrogenase